MKKKIVFLSFHNWDTKRQGGFHKLAEYTCMRGYEVLFFSYPRPLWFLLRRSDVYNYRKIYRIVKGANFKISNGNLTNRTILTMSLPIPSTTNRFFPSKILNFFEKLTLPRFEKFANRHFRNTDYFVFESTASVVFAEQIKGMFPKSKIIYRPSDPLAAFEYGQRFVNQEIALLKNSDMVFLVNKEGLKTYRKIIPNFDKAIRYKVLSNGVDIKEFEKTYPCPEPLKRKRVALYVGARPIDWNLIINTSKRMKDVNFVIVCPVESPSYFKREIRGINNILYIKGIERKQVAEWITNTDVVIVPNPRNWYKKYPWGITAKYFQAMAAKKPIVAYHDTKELEDLNIPVAYDTEEFVSALETALERKKVDYPIDLKGKDWEKICREFVETIEKI